MNKEELIKEQLKVVNAPVLIDDVIGGNGSEVYVEFKSRSSRFKVNEELALNINEWLDNLPLITKDEIKYVIKKYDVTLEKVSELLEDEELKEIKNVDEWVKVYNAQDAFLPIDIIDRMIEVNR